MAAGVNWSERRDGDWLASNGRWYPASNFPRGWNTSALPPAPGHRDAQGLFASAANRMTSSIADGLNGNDADYSSPVRGETVYGHSPRSPAPPSSPPSARPAAGGPAQATVTSQRTHTSRLPSGPKPAAGLPPAPGRFTNDQQSTPSVPPPRSASPARIPPPSTQVRPPMPGSGTATGAVVAGDLGKVFGAARDRIEKAIEDLE